jgi:hypothetical protein
MEIHDSNQRENFQTGAVRDISDGKGNPSLIAADVMAAYLSQNFDQLSWCPLTSKEVVDIVEPLMWKFAAMPKFSSEPLFLAMHYFLEHDYSSVMQRLAEHYQNGCKKYSKNNWRKGMPLSRYFDSCLRHLWKMRVGLADEDHASAALWNIIAIIQTKIDIDSLALPQELNDFPFSEEALRGKVLKMIYIDTSINKIKGDLSLLIKDEI